MEIPMKQYARVFAIIPALIPALILGAHSAARANTLVILRPKAEATGPHIRLADIARVDAKNVYAANAIAAAIIAPSPAAGDAVSFQREDIRRRLAEIGLDPDVTFSGAEAVVVSGYGSRLAATPNAYDSYMGTVSDIVSLDPKDLAPPAAPKNTGRALPGIPETGIPVAAWRVEAAERESAMNATRNQLAQAAEAYLLGKYSRDDVDVEAKVAGIPPPVPANAFDVRVTRELGGKVPGRAQFEATWRATAESQPETARFDVDVSVFAPAPVAARAIQKGERLTARDVEIRRVRMQAGCEYFIPRVDVVVGLAASKAIREGDPLLASDLQPPAVVKKGDTVRVLESGRGWNFEWTGKALADAGVNETVRVEAEVEKGKKTLRDVVVTGPGRARKDT